MELTEKQWKYGGAVLLAAISSLILTVGIMNVWVPMPIYIVILAWVTLVLFPVLTPATYLIIRIHAPAHTLQIFCYLLYYHGALFHI